MCVAWLPGNIIRLDMDMTKLGDNKILCTFTKFDCIWTASEMTDWAVKSVFRKLANTLLWCQNVGLNFSGWIFQVYLMCYKSKEQKGTIMGRKALLLLIMGVFVAYYIYISLPENIEEPWKLLCMTTSMKTNRCGKYRVLLTLNI